MLGLFALLFVLTIICALCLPYSTSVTSVASSANSASLAHETGFTKPNSIHEPSGNRIRALALKKSKTKLPVQVLALGPCGYTGLFVHRVEEDRPLLQLARLSLELKSGFKKASNSIAPYKFKHNFHVISSSKPIAHVGFLELLAKPNACCVMNDTVEEIRNSPKELCTSQVIYQAFYDVCDLAQSSTLYYVTSLEREDEVREAYQNDSSFTVTTVTGIIHACVLKSMFPNIKIRTKWSDANKRDTVFQHALDFMESEF